MRHALAHPRNIELMKSSPATLLSALAVLLAATSLLTYITLSVQSGKVQWAGFVFSFLILLGSSGALRKTLRRPRAQSKDAK
jgi:hypothetical protein